MEYSLYQHKYIVKLTEQVERLTKIVNKMGGEHKDDHQKQLKIKINQRWKNLYVIVAHLVRSTTKAWKSVGKKLKMRRASLQDGNQEKKGQAGVMEGSKGISEDYNR